MRNEELRSNRRSFEADVARRAVRDGEAKTIRRNRPCLGRVLGRRL